MQQISSVQDIVYISGKSTKSKKIADKLNKVGIRKINSNIDMKTIIVIGGDGELLHAIHQYIDLKKPFYGINTGTVGFLMNNISNLNNGHSLAESIIDSIISSISIDLKPLSMIAHSVDGQKYEATAVNEVSIFRHSNQAAKFNIKINDIEMINCLIADGIIVSTPAGSSAYNFSAGGKIIPLSAEILSLTPVCPFRPRRWDGAILPNESTIEFNNIDTKSRPINATADFIEVPLVSKILIKQSKNKIVTLLFDNKYNLHDRILKEQFMY